MSIRKLFSGYRIENEETSDMFSKQPAKSRKLDPQLDFVLCHHGHIGLWGRDMLYASLDRDFHLRGKLAALGQVVQDGVDGLTVTFPVERIEAVCRVMEPRRQYRAVA